MNSLFKLAAILAVALTVNFVCAAEATALQANVETKGSTANGGQQYVFDLPKGAVLMTVSVSSQKEGDHLALFLNVPSKDSFPVKGDASYASDNGWGGGSKEWLWLANTEELENGSYRLLVEKKGKETCEYTIVVRFQSPKEVRLGEEIVSTTADDLVNGAKFFYFDIDDEYDFLDVVTSSETKNNGLDLYLNTPRSPYFPKHDSYEFASKNGWGGGNQEWIAIDPPQKVMKGRYHLSVPRPGDDVSERFWLSVTAEKIPVLANRKPMKKTTRRNGEYFYFEVPEGAKQLTITTESIVKEDIVDLYVNAPIDEAFPTTKAFRYSSKEGWGNGANEKIVITQPDDGLYYIWVSNKIGGNDYIIRATWE